METAAKLTEFVAAQEPVYEQVVRELTAGRKQSHWMWFIFPQLTGLGFSAMARKFGIDSLDEARSYLNHPVLGPRLRECAQLMLAVRHNDVSAVLGYPDDLKFRSCMTLFAAAAPEEAMFDEALKKYFGGERDRRTLDLLEQADGKN
jgi:uncharacterized protein (DUF1810 family)